MIHFPLEGVKLPDYLVFQLRLTLVHSIICDLEVWDHTPQEYVTIPTTKCTDFMLIMSLLFSLELPHFIYIFKYYVGFCLFLNLLVFVVYLDAFNQFWL